jgi:hypothetical protein
VILGKKKYAIWQPCLDAFVGGTTLCVSELTEIKEQKINKGTKK